MDFLKVTTVGTANEPDPNATPPSASRIHRLGPYHDSRQFSPIASIIFRSRVLDGADTLVAAGTADYTLWIRDNKTLGQTPELWVKADTITALAADKVFANPVPPSFSFLDIYVQVTNVVGVGADHVEFGIAPGGQLQPDQNIGNVNVSVSGGGAGLATAAKQDIGNASLASIDAKETTGNASLASIDGKLPAAAALSDAAANPTTTTVGAVGLFWDVIGSTIKRIPGYNVASDALTDPARPVPIVGSFLVAWDNAGAKWRRLLTDTNGSLKTRNLDSTGAATFPNSATPADATAYGSLSKIVSKLVASNGATDDMVRAGLTTLSTVVTGFLNVLPSAVYNASPTTRTEGQFGPLQASASGSLRTREEAFPSGQTVADAMANPLLTQINVLPQGFNGTTWDRLRAGLTTVQTAFTGMLNILPFGKFNLIRPVLADTNGAVFQVDQYGNLKVVEQASPDYEDNANDLAWVLPRACSDSLGAWTPYQSGTTKVGATGLNVKNAAGRLRRAFASNFHATNVYWLVVVDKASAPVNNDAVIAKMKLVPNSATPTADSDPIDVLEGIYCANGVSLAISTTCEKVTLPLTSDCHIDALYG